jgi:hypothetical protein
MPMRDCIVTPTALDGRCVAIFRFEPSYFITSNIQFTIEKNTITHMSMNISLTPLLIRLFLSPP